MSIITLISDYGLQDYHVSMIKGSLLKQNLGLKIVDISHEVEPFNILQAGFLLREVYPYYPEGTIHLIGVEAESYEGQKHLLVKQDGHYFIGADNGVFSLLGDSIQEIVAIDHPRSMTSITPMRDVFPDIVTQILEKKMLNSIGKPVVGSIKKWKSLTAIQHDDFTVIGHVIYVDRFGNLITDIERDLFEEKYKDRPFTIAVGREKITKVHHKYSDFLPKKLEYEDSEIVTNAGKVLAVFNAVDKLEIALFKSNPKQGGSASKLLGIRVYDTISVTFE